jgi:hypothetical protein
VVMRGHMDRSLGSMELRHYNYDQHDEAIRV